MEAGPVARLLGVSHWNSLSHAGPITAGANQLGLFITGMGPKRARERAAEILAYAAEPRPRGDSQSKKPDAAIIIGVCGGLIDSLPETAIVTYSSCFSAGNDGLPCPCSPELSAQTSALLNAQGVACRSVIGVTSERIAITKDDKLWLARTGAQVVDMESYEILSAARKAGIPATVVRVVSDSLNRKLPDLNRALNADGSVNSGKALRVMLGSPVLTASAFAANKRAVKHLVSALKIVLYADFLKLQ